MKPKIILASTSPRRNQIAQQMGLEVTIMPSNYEEDMTMKLSPSRLAKQLAHGKAKDVAERVKEGIIIGIDTFITIGNKKIGKPKDKKDASRIVNGLSGKTAKIYSGVSIINAKTGKTINDYEVTRLKFRKITKKEIQKYTATEEPMDKAGAIAIQGLGSIFIKKVNGCYANVVGFPIHNIYKNLTKMGVDIFSFKKWKKQK